MMKLDFQGARSEILCLACVSCSFVALGQDIPSAGVAPVQGAPATSSIASDAPRMTELEETWNFNPFISSRDPFTPVGDIATSEIPDVFRYEFSDMTLLAIMSGIGKPRALILFPNGRTTTVEQGELIGKGKGRITKISENELFILNRYVNAKNEVIQVTNKLVISP